MSSLILHTAVRALQPAMLLLSVAVLAVGHNAPGGGFVGGLLAAGAFSLHVLAFDARSARRALRVDPRTLIAGGLVLAVLAATVPLVASRPFLTGLWTDVRLPGGSHLALGTPLLFDLGVFLLVTGVVLVMVFALEEEQA